MSELHNEMIKNGIHYTLHGDYYLPDLEVGPGYPLGKYGMARMQYLQEHRPIVYNRLCLTGKLNDDLHQADTQTQHLLDMMIPQMAEEAGVTGELKMEDQLRWVGMMNAIKGQVEEIIWNEIITHN